MLLNRANAGRICIHLFKLYLHYKQNIPKHEQKDVYKTHWYTININC